MVLVALGRVTQAQEYGISIGRVWSTVDWTDTKCAGACGKSAPNSMLASFAPGVIWEPHSERAFGLSTEVRYMRKGYDVTTPTLHVHYLEVPALLRVGRVMSRDYTRSGFFNVGPAVSIRVLCTLEPGTCSNQPIYGDWRVKWYDLSFVAGPSFALRSNDGILVVSARADWGLIDIGHDPHRVTKTRAYMLHVSWIDRSK